MRPKRQLLRPILTDQAEQEISGVAGVCAFELGNRVILKSGCVIGMEGFGFAQDDKGRSHRIPQTGRVVIEDDVVMGAHCNVDRATWAETRIRAGCKFDALCHVAHNVDFGEDCIVVAQTGVAGSVLRSHPK